MLDFICKINQTYGWLIFPFHPWVCVLWIYAKINKQRPSGFGWSLFIPFLYNATVHTRFLFPYIESSHVCVQKTPDPVLQIWPCRILYSYSVFLSVPFFHFYEKINESVFHHARSRLPERSVHFRYFHDLPLYFFCCCAHAVRIPFHGWSAPFRFPRW